MPMKVFKVYVEDPTRVIPLLGPNFQIVRARCIEEVLHAAVLSRRAFERGTNHARTLGGELLMRLAGTIQISEAIEKVGVSKGVNYAVLFDDRSVKGPFTVIQDNKPCYESVEELKMSFERMALVEVK